MLTKIKKFAQYHDIHVWFVAHPRQLHDWRGQAPNLYDISGSANFVNKADNGLVVHRSRDPNLSAEERAKVQVWHSIFSYDITLHLLKILLFFRQILVRKVRNKAAGQIGDCVLR